MTLILPNALRANRLHTSHLNRDDRLRHQPGMTLGAGDTARAKEGRQGPQRLSLTYMWLQPSLPPTRGDGCAPTPTPPLACIWSLTTQVTKGGHQSDPPGRLRGCSVEPPILHEWLESNSNVTKRPYTHATLVQSPGSPRTAVPTAFSGSPPSLIWPQGHLQPQRQGKIQAQLGGHFIA